MADYYKVLGVSPSSSTNEIERAFYKLKAKFSSNDTEDPYFKNFYRRILEAHNVLSNDERRVKYDKIHRSEKIKFANKEEIKKNSIEPEIDYFKSNKTLIDEGGKIILSWKTSLADEVILMPSGMVSIIGSKIIRFNELDGDEVLYRLKAINKSSGREVLQEILIQKSLKHSVIIEKTTNEQKLSKEKSQDNLDKNSDSNRSNENDSGEKNIKKYAIPSGIGILLIAITLFVLGKSGFWESSSQPILMDNQSNFTNDKPEDTRDIDSPNEEIFTEKSLMLNGEMIQYYDAELVFNELFSEIEKYSIPNKTGFQADVKQFFNSPDNPIKWGNMSSSENKLTFNSQLNVGSMQQPYSNERDLVLERLNLRKTGIYGTALLSILEFKIQDSGPPFWEPNEKWEAFQRVFNSKFDRVILTDELNIIKEVYSLNQISSGNTKGYIIMNNGLRIPVSFSKTMTQDEPTYIKIRLYGSMNALMRSNQYLTRVEKEGRILNLLELENYRDFELVSQFYADNVQRYWDENNLIRGELKTLYQTAWSTTPYSMNDVQDLVMHDDSNFELITNFIFLNKEGDTISQLGSTHYTFNNAGLIEEVYGVDSDYTYQELRGSDFDYISEEAKIRGLLKAEDNRDYNKIASFYAADMTRYWNIEDPAFIQIRNTYQDAWRTSSYSQNNILNIMQSDYNTYDVEVSFTFYSNETNQAITRTGITRYVFNEKGLIKEIYGLKDNQL